jgi:hypothetical protein
VDPYPDPGGPKTRGSGGSGSATLLLSLIVSFGRLMPKGIYPRSGCELEYYLDMKKEKMATA